jgi:hypothetical protein
MAWFKDDEMISPPQSAIFGEQQEDGTIIPMNQTETYESLGLDTLVNEGRVIVEIPRQTYQFDHGRDRGYNRSTAKTK